jgi:hypothetical protein
MFVSSANRLAVRDQNVFDEFLGGYAVHTGMMKLKIDPCPFLPFAHPDPEADVSGQVDVFAVGMRDGFVVYCPVQINGPSITLNPTRPIGGAVNHGIQKRVAFNRGLQGITPGSGS